MRGLWTILRLSLSDYFHERLLSACAVLGLAAVLAPLLVLFGVKSGIINTMADRLIEDPRNREISLVGSRRFDPGWFSEMAGNPEVAFIIPQTRSIAATMTLSNKSATHPASVSVDLIPTDRGDPLLEKFGTVPVDATSVVLSETAGRKLNVSAGEVVLGSVGRSLGDLKEQVSIELKVVGVLPPEAFQREAAFVPLALLTATEDYRDGRGSAALGWPGNPGPAGPRSYPSFRLYARSIYDVASLRKTLLDQGLEVYTRVEEIEVVQRLDRSFTLVFRLIFFVAVFGYFASMASNILANVKRKSRYLGITRLIGFSTGSIIWFPVIQSMASGIFGTGVAVGLYLIAEWMINRLFAQYLHAGEYVCKLSPGHMLMALALTICLSMLASAYAAFRVAKIEPSEVIRDV